MIVDSEQSINNRRLFPRTSWPLPAAFRGDQGDWAWTRVIDFSLGGIRLQTFDPLPEGHHFEFRLYLPHHEGEKVVQAHGTVVWSQPTQEASLGNTCGVQFHTKLPPELSQTFVLAGA
jgi:hypothetical protein